MEKAIRPPDWLALLAPLPAEAVPETKPVAYAEQLEKGTAGPIADWQSVTVNLWVPEGSRNMGEPWSLGAHARKIE